MNVGAVRVDLRFDESFKHLDHILGQSLDDVKLNNPRPFIKGFYNINKTDVLFSKLKNKRVQRQDEAYIGEIVDVERDFSMALLIKSKHQKISVGDEIKILTPEGKVKEIKIAEMTRTNGSAVSQAGQNEIVMLPFVRGIVGKSQVYLQSKT